MPMQPQISGSAHMHSILGRRRLANTERFLRFGLMMMLMVLVAGLLSACNTVEGMAQDLETTGDAIEETTDNLAN